MIWTWEMQLAAGGLARLAAEQQHHGPMFEYTGVSWGKKNRGINEANIIYMPVAHPPPIKRYRYASVCVMKHRTVPQCTGHQHHCHPGDVASDANWIRHHDKTTLSPCHSVTVFDADVTESDDGSVPSPVQVQCCGHLHCCCCLTHSVTGSSWTQQQQRLRGIPAAFCDGSFFVIPLNISQV